MKIKKAKSSPKLFSAEFLFQNHADIFGTFIVGIVLSLMFEPTSRHAFKLVAPQYNLTDPTLSPPSTASAHPTTYYGFGVADSLCVVFYSLVWVVIHGLIQQQLLDKSARKLHLSKIKCSKYNESGQLLTFYIGSLVGALELIRRDYVTRSSFAEALSGDPHPMTCGTKMFFIAQIAYWAHCIPEFYLQRVRKEEIGQRSVYVFVYLGTLVSAYVLSITRISLFLLVLHYIAEAIFHAARLLYFRQSSNNYYPLAFKVWNVTFVAARLASVTLSILVFYMRLGSSQADVVGDTPSGSPSLGFRLAVLAAIFAVQIHLMWKYLFFHLRRMRPATTAPEGKKAHHKTKHD